MSAESIGSCWLCLFMFQFHRIWSSMWRVLFHFKNWWPLSLLSQKKINKKIPKPSVNYYHHFNVCLWFMCFIVSKHSHSARTFQTHLKMFLRWVWFHLLHHWGRLSVVSGSLGVKLLLLGRSQSRGWGSAIGMVWRTSSRSCRALCRWISIQQGVSLMLWRG